MNKCIDQNTKFTKFRLWQGSGKHALLGIVLLPEEFL